MTKEEKAEKRQQMLNDLEDGARHADQRAKANDYMAASMYTAQALKAAQYLTDKDSIAKLKPQLIEFNKKAVYQEFDYSVQLPKDEINALINSYVNEPAGEISLFKLAYSRVFVPDSDEITKSAQETLPISTQIVTQHVVDNEGNTISIDDAENHWRWERYGDDQQFRTRLLGVIWHRLLIEGRIDEASIFSILNVNPIFAEDELSKIEVGVERYIAKDYTSALHILVPTFEGVFVRISGMLGVDVIRLGRSDPTTGSKVMSEDLLDAPETHAVWSKDFCDQIKFVMLLKYGYRLRHRVAHGQITPKECNHYNVGLVLSMLMRIAVTVIPTDPYASIKQHLSKPDDKEAKAEDDTDIKPSDNPESVA